MIRPFPVLQPGDGPAFVRWDALNEEQAQKNHGQSLETLARRGGLCPSEIFGNVRGIGWGDLPRSVTPEVLATVRSIAFDQPLNGAGK